jgi:hypothetical protein
MTHCIRCGRTLKHPTETGLGPVCAQKAKAVPVPEHDRDLFGYDIAKAVHAACYRLTVQVETAAAEARFAVRQGFRDARERLGVL